jgi:hypothetical protein
MRDETIAHRSDLRENQHAARGLAPMTLLRARYSANGLEGLASQLALTSAALFRRASSWALAALSSGLGLLGAVGGGDGTAGPGLHPPSSSLESPGTAVPGAVLREPASFSALQLRPRPRNVKLARFAQRKAPIRWRHGLLPGMVRSGGGARCRGALSPAIVSWAQNCERADGASGEHLQQGCLTCKAPRRPSRPRQQGRSLRYCGRRRPPAKRGKAPPSHQQR